MSDLLPITALSLEKTIGDCRKKGAKEVAVKLDVIVRQNLLFRNK